MLTEELKAYPWGDVYNYFLESHGVKSDEDWYQDVEEYEKEVLSKRG